MNCDFVKQNHSIPTMMVTIILISMFWSMYYCLDHWHSDRIRDFFMNGDVFFDAIRLMLFHRVRHFFNNGKWNDFFNWNRDFLDVWCDNRFHYWYMDGVAMAHRHQHRLGYIYIDGPLNCK